MSEIIKPYFNYYLRKYAEIWGEMLYIEIPYKDGSKSLDEYFIKPLKEMGADIHENDLLNEYNIWIKGNVVLV